MTLRSYTWGMRLVTLFSFGALALVVHYVDPEATGVAGKVVFYAMLFFALSGMFNLMLLRLRREITDCENAFANVGLSFRQGVLLAMLVVGILILQGLRILVWWDALLLLFGILLIELYFLLRD